MQNALRNIGDLPGPRPWPLLGNLPDLKPGQIHLCLERWGALHGPLFRFSIGGRRFLAVTDHTLIATILRDRPDGFRRTARLEEMWLELGLEAGVFGAHGDTWQRQRRMVMAGFDPRHVSAYFPSLARVTDRLHGRWAKAARAGAAIELQPDLMRFTVDAITGLAFGADINTLESDDQIIQQHLDKLFPALFTRVLALFPTWRWFKLPADRALERSVVEVKRAIDGFIAQARQRLDAQPALRSAPTNLLDAMIVAADEGDSGLDDHDVAGNVITMLLAGEDTTANTLAWMVHLLWRHPAALQRATDEVRRVVGDGCALTQDQMAQLDYIEACAHETMRLKPVAPVLPQQALRDCVVGDVRVPAGTVVWNVMRADSLSDALFPHADRFDPQRWLGGDEAPSAASAKRVSMPFGAGPRVCPGRYLALLEMKMAMAMLLGRFDIVDVDTASGGSVGEYLAFTMAPVGLRMRLRERSNANG